MLIGRGIFPVNTQTFKHAYVTCVSTWTKAVPCVAGSICVSMLYLNITLIPNTTELFTNANDAHKQQLTTEEKSIDT